MWITKKKWNEMRDVVNKLNAGLTRQRDSIDRLEKNRTGIEKNRIDIDNLINAHHKYEEEELGYTRGGLPVSFKTRLVTKYNHAIDTDEIKGVSLEELARYVIDGTPIERDKTVKVKYYKGGE